MSRTYYSNHGTIMKLEKNPVLKKDRTRCMFISTPINLENVMI